MIILNFKNNDYKGLIVNKPYTKVDINTVLEPEVVSLIIISYAGIKGEITAIFQYSYQSFITKPTNEDLHEILEEVSINEMIHFEILSQILLSQKIDPKFCRYIDNNPNICEEWSAKNINYKKDIVSFLEYNILLEQAAIDTYRRIVAITQCIDLKNIIKRIIEDEEAHLKIFKRLLASTVNNIS